MTNAKDPSQSELKEEFRINSEGNLERFWRGLYWRIIKNVINHNKGYCRVYYKGNPYFYHRIIWILIKGNIKNNTLEIDHIDGNKLNNKIENLRLVKGRENSQNRKDSKINNKIGYCWDKKHNKWKPQIQINNKSIHLGLFSSDEDASQIYQIACENIHQYISNKQFLELCKNLLKEKML